MKTKISLILYFLLVFNLTFLNAQKLRTQYATKNLQGQEYYLKNCSFCHGEGNRGGNMASIKQWEALFLSNAKQLVYLHEDEEENKEVLNYLKSKKFKKEEKLLLKFLQEFAYDSENIPTCN